MQDLTNALRILSRENCTCVLCKTDTVYKSTRRGVAPLLQLLDESTDVRGFCAADRVVGKATAFLYCLLGVKQVHALVMSKPAYGVLRENGIDASYDTLVDGILNRQQSGPCPMEAATREIAEPAAALAAIRTTLQRLQKQQ